MPKIQQLSPHMADLIAAGEVVERPASAAKELVENAIDAGAKHITVELKNGGMTFLRITDDGCGMEAEDAETAFLRHATSKLRQASDLEAIHTLGFRGEALAAISAVSKIDLLTKTPEDTLGTSLHLDAGVVTERERAGCPDGTTIIVRDLFYNTPARMKFMKQDTVEGSTLIAAVERLAIAHPEVSIRVIKDGKEQLQTPGDGKLLSAVATVFGRQLAKDMVEVNSHWEKYTLTGYVTKPAVTRGNRSNQLFFVNGRHVRSRTMTAALEEAYRNQMMVGRFPSCVLHVHLPEHLVDVNVHPAKTEVKFINERDLFDCIRYGVMGALDKASGRVTMTLPGGHGASAPKSQTLASPMPLGEERPRPAAKPKQDFFRTMSPEDYKAFRTVMEGGAKEKPVTPKPGAPTVPVTAPAASTVPATAPASPEPEGESPPALPKEPVISAPAPRQAEPPKKEMPEPEMQESLQLPLQDYRIVGEVLNTYIIVEQGRSILLIDKHAAHERILFEKYRKQAEPILGQLLLTPIICEPEREEASLLLENTELLEEYGFEISDYGGGTLAIRQVPADIDPEGAESLLNQIATDLKLGKRLEPTALRDQMLHTIACKAAIKGGWHTDDREREALVRQVLSRKDLKYCPHGRPICVEMTASQLERQFKRA